MNIRNYKKEELISLLNESNSYADFLDKIGYAKSGNAYKFTQKYLNELNINYEGIVSKRWSSKEISIEEAFVYGSKCGTKELKNKIKKWDLKPYFCEKCNNNGHWMGEVISLHLDHINGDNRDNRLNNLRFLCPNCHSQTKTYGGKNNKK